jgi:hypothetical protein
LSTNQLRIMIGLLTEHSFKRTLFKLGQVNGLECVVWISEQMSECQWNLCRKVDFELSGVQGTIICSGTS